MSRPVSSEPVGIHDVISLVEFAREHGGRLVIGTGFDGEYRVQLDFPNGFAVNDRNLIDALRRAVESMERYRR